MSEHQPPQRETLSTFMIGERSLQDWHTWLNTDQRTGKDVSAFRVPASRYGSTSEEVAWWAVAGAMVLQHANGKLDDDVATIDNLMAGAVNDSQYVAEIVRDYLLVVPDELQEKLDWDEVDWRG